MIFPRNPLRFPTPPTRGRAANMLTFLTGLALVILVISIMVANIRTGSEGVGEQATQLMLGITTLLVGAVSGFLARKTLDDPVGWMLTVTLGVIVLTLCGFVLIDAVFSSGPGLSDNMSNVLASLFGGVVGAVVAYLSPPTDTGRRESDPGAPEGDPGAD